MRYLLALSYLVLFGTIGIFTTVLLYLGLTKLLWIFGLFRMEDRIHTVLRDIPATACSEDFPDREARRLTAGPLAIDSRFSSIEQIPVNQLASPFFSAAVLDVDGNVVSRSDYFDPAKCPVDPARLQVLARKTQDQMSPSHSEDDYDPRTTRLLWSDPTGGEVLLAPLVRHKALVGFVQMRATQSPERLMVQRFLSFAALGLTLAGLATIWLSIIVARRWAHPLEVLADAAHKVAGGDMTARTGLQPAASELREVARTFDSMVEQLEGQFAVQQRFVADASHELKTPLAALEGQLHILSLLEERPPEPRRAQALANMNRDLERMDRLVRDLLTLSKAERVAPQFRPISALELAHEAASSTLASERIFVSGPEVQFLGEMEALEGALRNLMDNALRHSSGRVEVRVAVDAGFLRLAVIDTGTGIAASHLPHLGERFYRVDAGRARTDGGSGLGLSIVRAVAEKHGGELQITSQFGSGTQASILLPLRLLLPKQ